MTVAVQSWSTEQSSSEQMFAYTWQVTVALQPSGEMSEPRRVAAAVRDLSNLCLNTNHMTSFL